MIIEACFNHKDILDPNLHFFGVIKSENVTTSSWNIPFWGGAKRTRVTNFKFCQRQDSVFPEFSVKSPN